MHETEFVGTVTNLQDTMKHAARMAKRLADIYPEFAPTAATIATLAGFLLHPSTGLAHIETIAPVIARCNEEHLHELRQQEPQAVN